ncbi:MAG: hypothetical protein CSA52_01445 [Gammaproteobacteria bacterium]|nr:MAG: hypothetical protein CSB48_09945 [Pseudomonadota bacterium]PIE38741.1 MAG: hypothetical protein CSA52_01445 [Gammaproteobacteria bacterium]
MKLSNPYASLNAVVFEQSGPTPVASPMLVLFNAAVAKQLEIPCSLTGDSQRLANIFSGNQLLPGSEPVALAYSGHQFGHFSPQLGDGRAHLLGAVTNSANQVREVQLKGSGRTAFSRGGDGRCALGPAVREYVMSEAIHALGIPTTRSLCVVTTGEQVMRETPRPGAVITRVASSHIRVGTFQFYACRGKTDGLRAIANYTIARHYPGMESRPDPYLALLDAVIEKQIELVVHWMRVGFIHGVMNTDNTALSGETIDFGPCAMMGAYDPKTVFSSIDEAGRYAFGNQPGIIHWNMARFAETLLPLIDQDTEKAISQVEPPIHGFPERFEACYKQMMADKLGLDALRPEDTTLITGLLEQLQNKGMDYTNSFMALTESQRCADKAKSMADALGDWFADWQHRLSQQNLSSEDVYARMKRNNPVVIPRNHHMEKVIDACVQSGDYQAAEDFLEVLGSPYLETEKTAGYQDLPEDGDRYYKTFCGT